MPGCRIPQSRKTPSAVIGLLSSSGRSRICRASWPRVYGDATRRSANGYSPKRPALSVTKSEAPVAPSAPELTDAWTRWRGDPRAILQEILEPSHRIDAQYAVHLVVTRDGQTFSGIVRVEDRQSVQLLANPESNELTVIPRSNIDEMVPTSTSLMPKALLDHFTKDEIFELLAYLRSVSSEVP